MSLIKKYISLSEIASAIQHYWERNDTDAKMFLDSLRPQYFSGSNGIDTSALKYKVSETTVVESIVGLEPHRYMKDDKMVKLKVVSLDYLKVHVCVEIPRSKYQRKYANLKIGDYFKLEAPVSVSLSGNRDSTLEWYICASEPQHLLTRKCQ